MKLPIYQFDAFSDKVFKGNYAAVVPLERWLPDSLMQAIATENNLSENVPVECEIEIEIDGGDRSLV